MVPVERSSFRIEPLVFYFTFKGNFILKRKKTVSAVSAKIFGLSMSCQFPPSANSRKPKKNCRHKSQNRFKVANVVKLLALNVNVFLQSVLCSGRPMYMNKPHTVFWLKPKKPVFCNLNSKFPLNLKIKYQLFKTKGRPVFVCPCHVAIMVTMTLSLL